MSYLCQVFTRECMSHYLRVFNFLWRAKRMEYILTDIWKGQMCNAKLLKSMPGECRFHWVRCYKTNLNSARSSFLGRQMRWVLCICAELSGVLHQCHVLASEMVHFIHQMQYYITFEVRPSVCLASCFSFQHLIVSCLFRSRFWSALVMSCGIRSSWLRIWITL